jgi:hypothetical protein
VLLGIDDEKRFIYSEIYIFKMERGYASRILTGLALGVGAFSFGCNDKIRVPAVVPVYSERGELDHFIRIDEDARFIFESYINNALISDFNRALPKILNVVDANGDHKIGHDEAYETINIYRPAFKNIIERLTDSRVEYAAKIKKLKTKDEDLAKMADGNNGASNNTSTIQAVPVSVKSIGK